MIFLFFLQVDIYRQLLAGVRFLDVSVMTRGNDVWTCADNVRGVKLEEVLTKVRDFVSDNPSEVVVVHITTDQGSVDWTSCHVLIQQFFRNRLIPEHMRDMTIGQSEVNCRGQKGHAPTVQLLPVQFNSLYLLYIDPCQIKHCRETTGSRTFGSPGLQFTNYIH